MPAQEVDGVAEVWWYSSTVHRPHFERLTAWPTWKCRPSRAKRSPSSATAPRQRPGVAHQLAALGHDEGELAAGVEEGAGESFLGTVVGVPRVEAQQHAPDPKLAHHRDEGVVAGRPRGAGPQGDADAVEGQRLAVERRAQGAEATRDRGAAAIVPPTAPR